MPPNPDATSQLPSTTTDQLRALYAQCLRGHEAIAAAFGNDNEQVIAHATLLATIAITIRLIEECERLEVVYSKLTSACLAVGTHALAQKPN